MVRRAGQSLALVGTHRYQRLMQKDMRKKLGVAAVVLLAPGGFVLGAALIARHLRNKRAQAEAETPRED